MIARLLKTLEENPTSAFRKKELLGISRGQFEKVKAQGFLTYCQPDPYHETYPCPIPCPKACPMDVVNMEGNLFAICPEDTEVDPIPLTKDDITRYGFSLDMIIKAIREANGFGGDTYVINPRLHFIGEQVIGNLRTAFVLALFANVQAAEPHLLSLPARIATYYQQVVVVAPSLSLIQEPIYAKLRNASITPVTLPPSFGQRDFKISYLAAIKKRLRPGEVTDNYVFRCNGDFWQIVFQGKALPAIRHNKRLLYVWELLKRPHKEISALALCRMVNGTEQQISDKEDHAAEDDYAKNTKNAIGREESLNVIDDEGVREYDEDLKGLGVDLDRAKRDHDEAEEGRIQGEIDFIIEQLTSNHGVGGKIRKFADEIRRAGGAVGKGVKRAKDDIRPYSEELFQHLENTMRAGENCSYKPDQDIDWQY